MPESHGIPKTVIVSFIEHPVWDEIWKRMNGQLEKAMNKAIDEQNAYEAGRYRVLQTIKNLPQLLIQELEKDVEKPAKSSRVTSIRKWL